MSDLNKSMLNFQFYEEHFRSRDKIYGREEMQRNGQAVKTTRNSYK